MTLIWKFFTCLFGREQDVPLYGKIALPLVVVSVALMAPGWRDAALSYLNKTYNLGLSLDAPWWVGAVFAGATNDVTKAQASTPTRHGGSFWKNVRTDRRFSCRRMTTDHRHQRRGPEPTGT